MVTCKLCEKEFKTFSGLGTHLSRIHNISNTENYYLKYVGKKGYCNFCGEETKYNGLLKGYQKYCGLKCSNNDPDRKEKFRNSYLNNDLQKIKEKRENTNLIRYENKNANLHPEIKERSRRRYLKGQISKKIKYLKEFDIEILSDFKYNNYSEIETFKCQKCGLVFEETIVNIFQRMYKCKCQRRISTSIGENEVKDFIKELLPNENILFNEKIENKEIDILIPSKKIAIEYNGLYWHSEQILKNPVEYHNEKLSICSNHGYNLLQIFEDEWVSKNEIVKNRLKHILNESNNKSIYARNCIIKEISSNVKNLFLNKYHLQGKDICYISLGAFFNHELVSIMTFSKGNISKGSKSKEGVWELNRFCSNYNYQIVGIAGKLLTYFKRNYTWKKIFSYADRRWSSGNLYYQLGFNLEYITKPNYWYTKDGMIRIHRFNLRKTLNDPKDLPEWLLRYKEGYYRIWDCGNYKFSINNGGIN